MEKYEPQAIEAKWQQVWEAERAFFTDDPEPGEEREKFYMLEMLPYPSGDLHMGHVLNYTLGDVLTHFRRRQGLRVLRPMGWDSFGLPAENAAIREGGHPREITERNITNIVRQMRRLGWAIDWDRVIAAHDPSFYRWTQWLFLRFFEKGLAYRKEAPVNWCPNDQTVLANEQVIDGRCERCGAVVEARKMEQWFFRITAYADALLEDHALIDWPDRTITIQRNWIGRSEGAELLFRSEDGAVVLPDHGVRGRATGGSRADRLARPHDHDPAELDRALGGRGAAVSDRGAGRGRGGVYDASGHGLRRDVLRPGARASAGRHDDRALAERRGDRRVRAPGDGQARRGAGRRGGEDPGLHRLHGHEPGYGRGDSGLGRRVRADGVRDRRDHVRSRARRARPGVRRAVRAAGARGRRRGGRLAGRVG